MNWKEPRNLLWLLPLLLAVTMPLWRRPVLAFLEPRGTLAPPAVARPYSRSFRMESVDFFQFRGNRLEWLAGAGRLTSGAGENDLVLEEVRAELFRATAGEEPEPPVLITAGRGVYEAGKELFRLFDGVEVLTGEGYRLESSRLDYLAAGHRFEAAGGVTANGPGFQAAGRRLSYSLDSGDFTLAGSVRFESVAL